MREVPLSPQPQLFNMDPYTGALISLHIGDCGVFSFCEVTTPLVPFKPNYLFVLLAKNALFRVTSTPDECAMTIALGFSIRTLTTSAPSRKHATDAIS